MSSDFNIATVDLLNDDNIHIRLSICEYTKEVIPVIYFNRSVYYRQCDLDTSKDSKYSYDRTLISCSGKFRVWLRDYLTANNIEYKEY